MAEMRAQTWPNPDSRARGAQDDHSACKTHGQRRPAANAHYLAQQEDRTQGAKQRGQVADGGDLADRDEGERVEPRLHGQERDCDANAVEARALRSQQRAPAVDEKRRQKHAGARVAQEHDFEGMQTSVHRLA